MHESVLRDEVIAGLMLVPGSTVIDATLGGGGHAETILQATSPTGRLIGFDRDASALLLASERLAEFGDRFRGIHDSYAQIAAHRELLSDWLPVNGIVLDAGLSSMQLDDPERGFAFRFDAPLDMRFDERTGETAADMLNGRAPEELARIFAQYGEVQGAGKLARAIATDRTNTPFHTTRQLVELIDRVLPRRGKRTHPAARVFQALRIAVNDELGQLERFLPLIPDLLAPGGRVAIISFHSLEDRMVKQFFKDMSQDCVCSPEVPECRCSIVPKLDIITKKPITPTEDGIKNNQRARSAKLRIAQKI